MDALAQLAALLAAAAAVLTATYAAFSLREGRRTLERRDDERSRTGVLADQRSCFQETLTFLHRLLREPEQDPSSREAALNLIALLKSNPHLSLAEVIDDRALLSVEQTTSASQIWIVQSDESIEFEYPTAAVTFSQAVLDNLSRGIVYKYLVAQTPETRERVPRIIDIVRKDGFDDQMQIRFLPSHWESKIGRYAGWVIYKADKDLDLYYRFPTLDSVLIRKWIRVPQQEALNRFHDLETLWDLAIPASEVLERGGASPLRKDAD